MSHVWYRSLCMHVFGVFIFIPMLVFSEPNHPATKSHYLNLQLHYTPAPPQGGHLNTQPPLISWRSYSVPVLYNSHGAHSSATPLPRCSPFSFYLNDVASAPFLETTLEMFQPSVCWRQLQDPEGDHSNQQITVTKVKLLATALHGEQLRLMVQNMFKLWFIRLTVIAQRPVSTLGGCKNTLPAIFWSHNLAVFFHCPLIHTGRTAQPLLFSFFSFFFGICTPFIWSLCLDVHLCHFLLVFSHFSMYISMTNRKKTTVFC